MRSMLAVLSGAIVWAVAWIGLNQVLLAVAPGTFSTGQPVTSVGGLVGLLIACVVLSVAAGYLTGIVARAREVAHASVLGVIQLGLGVYFELQYWELMPAWYHVVFLVSLLPAHAYGGVLRRARVGVERTVRSRSTVAA